jgi:hypothetical protein
MGRFYRFLSLRSERVQKVVKSINKTIIFLACLGYLINITGQNPKNKLLQEVIKSLDKYLTLAITSKMI